MNRHLKLNETVIWFNKGKKEGAKTELERHYEETRKTLVDGFCKGQESVNMQYLILIKILEDAYLERLKELG